ncbi:fluoride efflux transporter CrcB [Zophobihabitans entericus]|uniref:Fluoride-specific ion channel FluC n=1 Tax=Zophobihabitans entericus TaxID=1635327 RepID=A0A6G9ICB8_9GAMM|nr:fluoride efflux transporter CrcB [Zophobihabitans entericus]QIQ21878.1 fluoride efflux transporter CrcB [Zophobihabitans entericus]
MMVLMVAIGGAIGSVLRYWTTILSVQCLGTSFPFGTLIVNVLGSFILGLMLSAVEFNILLSPYWKPLITVGLLGGFTTFSTFSFDTLALFMQGEYIKGGLNIALNLVLGLMAVSLGYYLLKQ